MELMGRAGVTRREHNTPISAPPAARCCDRAINSEYFRLYQHGDQMTSETSPSPQKRVLVVEDEMMIRMLLDGMLTDLGHTVAAEAGRIDEAVALAKAADFDVAILDVNLNGQPITPVVEVLVERKLPFVFATGYGQRGVPEQYQQHPTLQKPFQSEALAKAIESAKAAA
jgi:CheY-like chemotaxis protein